MDKSNLMKWYEAEMEKSEADVMSLPSWAERALAALSSSLLALQTARRLGLVNDAEVTKGLNSALNDLRKNLSKDPELVRSMSNMTVRHASVHLTVLAAGLRSDGEIEDLLKNLARIKL